MEKHCSESWKKQVSEAQCKGHDYNMQQAFSIKESANSCYKECYIEAQKICPNLIFALSCDIMAKNTEIY